MSGYREIAPPAALRPFVECFWTLAAEPEPGGRLVLPDGCVDFLVDHRAGRARLVGAMTRAQPYTATTTIALAAVRFRPGGAHAFLRRDVDDLSAFTDAEPDLADLAPWTRDLARRAAGAASIADAAAVLQDELLRRRPDVDGSVEGEALRRLVAAEGSFCVGRQADELRCSRQHLARSIRRRCGLSPRELATILRFRRAAERLAAGEPPIAVAAATGYADQAHLTRTARELSGVTPRQLAAQLR